MKHMYIVVLIGLLGIWYLAHGKRIGITEDMLYNYEIEKSRERTFLIWLMPYFRSEDKKEQLASLLQVIVVAVMSMLNALKMSSDIEGIVVFCITFIVCTWFIKVMVATINWLQTYSRMLTLDGIFAICVPLVILWHMPKMCSVLEIRLTFLTLLLSTCIVYGEIIHIVVGQKMHLSKEIQIKSILTWLAIILMNLYALLVFVQFYMNVKAHHFIAAEHLTKEAMVDLFYYLIVTFTTVGFGDIRPSTSLAKIITSIIAISGMLFTGMFMGAVLSTDEKNK